MSLFNIKVKHIYINISSISLIKIYFIKVIINPAIF
jgi:hypothetical protein